MFAFFAQARNLELFTPGWLRFEVLTPEPLDMKEGTLIDYRLRLHGLPLRWRSRIERWEPGRAFVDRQVRGPYRLWHHRHEFEAPRAGTVVRDIVHYALPLGPLGQLAHAVLVARDLAGSSISATRRPLGCSAPCERAARGQACSAGSPGATSPV